MERAFENAAKSLSYGYPPADDEMRLYAIRIQNNPAIIRAKKASLTRELANANIHLAPHETFTDNERIRFGFDQSDLQQYMRSNLPWDPQVIDNDALAIWETHMRRQGNYSEYCGTGAQLPVFVTTNTRLIGIALKFREDRSETPSLYGWKQNRLPVITDIRLTCRLWSPANDSERMSLLVVKWPVTVTVIFSAITAGISLIIGNWHPMWAIALPTVLKIIETCSASNFVGKPLAKWLLPKIDESISKRISKELRKVEQPHKDTIIRRIKEQTELWVECARIMKSK